MINILVKEDNLMVFQPKLAKVLGLNETIILNQIHYWLEKKKNIIDGRPWVYNTYEDWHEQICFLSVSTIKKSIKKLESMGIVIANNFNRSKIDKTKWYTIDYEALQKLYEAESDECEEEITEDEISQTMDKNNQKIEVSEQTTDKNEPSKGLEISEEEVNSNRTIPETTTETTIKDNDEDDNNARGREASFLSDGDKKSVEAFREVVNFYSENIRLPSSYELERIKYLHDEFKDPELIILAMKQAIASNARNLRYMERVLYNWLDSGIKTSEEAEGFIESYRKYKGDREIGKFAGINGENKRYNSKASSKDSSKWAGYKPPKPKQADDIDIEGLI